MQECPFEQVQRRIVASKEQLMSNPDHDLICEECDEPLKKAVNIYGNLLGWYCDDCDIELYESEV